METVFFATKINRAKRAIAFALTLLLCLSVATVAAPAAKAASPLPPSNGEPRHTVCHTLSAQAQAYYIGAYSYNGRVS